MNGIKGTGEIKEHGSYCAGRPVQTHAEELVEHTTELWGTGFNHPRLDLNGACSLAGVKLPQLSSDRVKFEWHCGGDREGV
ncbi:uncharacterized [Tachysurus ichikawai]